MLFPSSSLEATAEAFFNSLGAKDSALVPWPREPASPVSVYICVICVQQIPLPLDYLDLYEVLLDENFSPLPVAADVGKGDAASVCRVEL